jgi:hexosaminidase
MKRFIISCILSVSALSLSAAPVSIIPQPAEVAVGQGSFPLNASTVYVVDFDDPKVEYAIEFFNGVSKDLFGTGLSFAKSARRNAIYIRKDETIAEEGYILEVTPKMIEIAASSPSGVYYAFQSLRQMVPAEALGGYKIENVDIQAARIKDEPKMKYRGFLMDVGRHFFDVEEIKTFIDVVAMHKMNVFHWHLTEDQGWRIDIRKYPLLAQVGSVREKSQVVGTHHVHGIGYDGVPYGPFFYTQDQIREVVSYAEKNFVTVIPEIDMPGHSLKVVESFPELSCGGVAKWGNNFSVPLCPGNDGLLTFAKNVYKEVFELFPYKYVHIGADEVEQLHWKNCPKCQARIRNLGLEDETALQGWFVSEMHDFFSENGKVMIGWDEIVSGDAPEDAVVMWWRGWRPDTRDAAAEEGHDLIISSSEYLYLSGDQNRNSLAKVYCWDPVMDGLEAYQDRVLGIQAHLWTELCPSFANASGRIFPRLFAVSENAWSQPEHKDFKDFESRVMKHIRDFDNQGLNYRIPDISGFCDRNVFIDSVEVEVVKPFADLLVRYTSDGSVPHSDSPIYEGPLTVTEECVLHFRSYTSSGMPGDIYRACYCPAEYIDAVQTAGDSLDAGLKADWYEYRGELCDSIETAAFNSSYITEGIYIPEQVKGNIGLIFTGYINIPEDGIYSFYTYSDDGSYIRIDGQMVVDSDGPHSRVERSGQAALKKGLHEVEARYFDHSGGILEAGWIMPDGERRRFSSGDFFH